MWAGGSPDSQPRATYPHRPRGAVADAELFGPPMRTVATKRPPGPSYEVRYRVGVVPSSLRNAAVKALGVA